jgi:hypothetical protein
VFGGVVEKRKSSTTTHCIVLVRCGRNRRVWREDSSSEGGGNRYSIGRLSCQRFREFTLSDPVAACSQSPVRSTCSCCSISVRPMGAQNVLRWLSGPEGRRVVIS